MYTEFHIAPSELDHEFLANLKALFKKSSRIAITVEDELDETEYLLRSEANRTMLEQSMKEAEDGKLVKVNIGKQ
tara:strand:- start:389 stop:613 length:225 start_codon:yes stop_codon:yes gene_type:complete